MKETSRDDEPAHEQARARMSASDAAQWEDIQRWKEAQISPRRPRVISQRLRSYLMAPLVTIVSVARKVPGGAAVARAVSAVGLGLMEKATSVSEASVRRRLILKAYREAGYDVECLQDIRRLGLDLDQIRPVRPHLKIAYSSAAAAEGAFSGVVASGGSIAAVLGLGVASAPGIALTASVVALDIATFLGAATRLVSHTAAYYGYDTVDPAENLFATMVLSQAIDPESAGEGAVVEKQTTMIAFNKVMRDLARRGSLDGLGGNVVVSAMNSLFSAMGVRLASRKLAQIVPVAGVVVSAGLNAALMRTIGETADHLYRERFLAERYGHVEAADGASTDLVRPADTQELRADIARYVEIAEAESRP